MFVDGGERLTATMLLQHATICDKTLQQLKTLNRVGSAASHL